MAADVLLLFEKWQGISVTIKELKMSRNSSKRNSSNRGSTGSDIARSTLKVFLSNGDSRSVKCGEATDVKVGTFLLLFASSCRGNIFLKFNVVILPFNRSKTLQEFLVGFGNSIGTR